jgi:hypothetical protein
MSGTSLTTKKVGKPDKRSIIWAATAVIAALLSLSAWAASSPIGSSPDDDYHNTSIWCGQGLRDGLCEAGPTPEQVLVPQPVYSNAFCFASQPDKSADCAQSSDMVPTIRVNSIQKLYPEGYYWFMSWFATEDVNTSIITMRIINSILTVFAFALVMIALPKHIRRVPLISVLVTSIPLGMFIFASVNPSAWTVFSVIIFFSSTLGLLSSNSTRQRILFGAISMISLLMGFSARTDAPSYLLLSAVLALILSFSFKNFSKEAKRYILAVGVAIVVFFVWRYVYPLFAVLQGVNFGVGEVDQSWQSVLFNLIRLPDLFVGVFGTWGLGWLDTPSPSSVWAVTYGIYVAVIFSQLRLYDRRQSVAAAMAFLALVFVPIQFLWANNLSVGSIVQPRYLLPMLAILAAVSMFRNKSDFRGVLSRGQIWIIGFGLFVANTIALHTNLRRYITGLDVAQVSLNFEMEWWWVERPTSDTLLWFSPNYLWLAGSFSFGVFLVSIWMLRANLALLGNSPSSEPETTVLIGETAPMRDASKTLRWQNLFKKRVTIGD